MASGSSKKRFGTTSPPVIRKSQGPPWLTIIAVAVVVILAGTVAWVVIAKHSKNSAAQVWAPNADNRDPSVAIPGVYIGAAVDNGANTPFTYPQYKAAIHVTATQRVNYDRYPPVGGPHDGEWAECEGTVYAKAVRDENMVHTLEHGAIWIAYNPDTVKGADLTALKAYVQGNGQSYISMSPYPGLKVKVSLQAWAHQLQLNSVSDPHIQEFITALRQNQYVYPETGATCSQPTFDVANPPAFDPSPRTPKDVQMNGIGAAAATNENGMGAPGTVPSRAAGSGALGSGAPVPSAAGQSGGAATGAATPGANGTTASR